MAISRGSTHTPNTDSSTPLDASMSHTVDSGTTLMLVSFHCEGNNSVSSVLWNGSEALTPVGSVETSSSGGDCRIYVFGIVNPTSGTHTLSWTVGGSGDNMTVVPVNYLGTETSSVAAATNVIDSEDNGNNAASTVAMSGATTSGAGLFIAGTFYGGDGDPATESNDGNFADVETGATGTSNFSDTSYYVGDDVDGGTGGTVSPTIDWTGSASDECVGIFIEILPAPTFGITSVDSTDYGNNSDQFDVDDDNIDVNGVGFEASQGTGTVYLMEASTLAASSGEIDLTDAISSWSDTEVGLDLTALDSTDQAAVEALIEANGHSLYLAVVNNSSEEDSIAVTVHRALAFTLHASTYITASGEDTTARMDPPSGKTTGDFGGGRIADDENPLDAVDLAADEYREDELSMIPTSAAFLTHKYYFYPKLGTSDPDTALEIIQVGIVVVPSGTAIVKIQAETEQSAEGDLHYRGRLKVEGETEQSSEGDLHTLGLVREMAETLNIAESDVKVRALVREQGETVQISESDIVVRGLVRIEGEDVEISEASIPVVGLLRLVNETIEVSESDLHYRGRTQVEGEDIEISETDLRIRALVRVGGEDMDVAEVALRIRDLVRLQAELVEISESDIRARARLKQEGETVEISESALYFRGLTRQEDEDVEISEGDIRFKGLVRQQDEDEEISEDDLHFKGLVRQEDEDEEVAESDLRFMGLVRQEGEDAEISEQDLRFMGLVRVFDETIDISESDLHFMSLVRQEDETVQLSEDEIHVLGLVRIEGETVEISETDIYIVTATGVAIVKVQDESIEISESDLHLRGLVQLVSETENVAEASLRLLGLSRVVSESVQVSEEDLRFRFLTRIQNETVEISESEVRVRDLIRLESELAQIVEDEIHARGLVKVFSEGIQVSEDDLQFLGKVQIFNEEVEISEVDLHFIGIVIPTPPFIEAQVFVQFKFRDLDIQDYQRDISIIGKYRDADVSSFRDVEVIDSNREALR